LLTLFIARVLPRWIIPARETFCAWVHAWREFRCVSARWRETMGSCVLADAVAPWPRLGQTAAHFTGLLDELRLLSPISTEKHKCHAQGLHGHQ
jgi:hypothetical protein